MIDPEFQSVIDTTAEIFRKSGEIRGVTFIVPSTGTILMGIWGDDREKDAFQDTFTRFCRQKMVTRFFMASEAWLAKAEGKNPEVRPVDHPDRVEVVFIQDISLSRCLMVYAPIVMGSSGGRTLGQWVDSERGHAGGHGESRWQDCLWKAPMN